MDFQEYKRTLIGLVITTVGLGALGLVGQGGMAILHKTFLDENDFLELVAANNIATTLQLKEQNLANQISNLEREIRQLRRSVIRLRLRKKLAAEGKAKPLDAIEDSTLEILTEDLAELRGELADLKAKHSDAARRLGLE